MNWKEIQEKYPKSINLFLSLENGWTVNGLLTGNYSTTGLLYFFDSQEIHCKSNVWFDYGDGSDGTQYSVDVIQRLESGEEPEIEGGHFNTRKEAEIEGFMNCFGLLEVKLSKTENK